MDKRQGATGGARIVVCFWKDTLLVELVEGGA